MSNPDLREQIAQWLDGLVLPQSIRRANPTMWALKDHLDAETRAMLADSILALRGEGEPVGYFQFSETLGAWENVGDEYSSDPDVHPLYAAPPASQALDEPGKCDHPPEKFCELCEPGLLAATKSACDKIIAAPAEAQARVDIDPEALARWIDHEAFVKRRRSSHNQHAANLAQTRARKLAKQVLKFAPISALLSGSSPKPARVEITEELAAALHPFALEAMEWSASTHSDVVPACGVRPTTTPAKFTVGDLRRAASAYASFVNLTAALSGGSDAKAD